MAHDVIPVPGKDENIIELNFKRAKGGLLVHVKAHPMVEEIIKSWGGTPADAAQHGRFWSAPEGAPPLRVYQLTQLIPQAALGPNIVYRIDRTGTLLIEGGDAGRAYSLDEPPPTSGTQVVNIGFLRLVGISKPEGVQFIVRSVFSYEALKQTHKLMMDAISRLFNDYMRPVELSMVISLKEK